MRWALDEEVGRPIRRLGYLPLSTATFEVLCNTADTNLFTCILNNYCHAELKVLHRQAGGRKKEICYVKEKQKRTNGKLETEGSRIVTCCSGESCRTSFLGSKEEMVSAMQFL